MCLWVVFLMPQLLHLEVCTLYREELNENMRTRHPCSYQRCSLQLILSKNKLSCQLELSAMNTLVDLAGQQLTQVEHDNLSLFLVSSSSCGGPIARSHLKAFGLLVHGLQLVLVFNCYLNQTVLG